MIIKTPEIGDIIEHKGRFYKIVRVERALGLIDPPTLKFIGFSVSPLSIEGEKDEKVVR